MLTSIYFLTSGGGSMPGLWRILAGVARGAARHPKLSALLGVAAAVSIGLAIYAWPETYLHSARSALERRDYDAARVSLRRYLEARPRSAEAHFLMAQLDRKANKYLEAAKHLDACQRCGGPTDAIKLERALGAIQRGHCDVELVRLCYEHLSRGDADEYLILEALSQGFLQIYRLDEARACLERMLDLQPDSAFALRRRAWIYAQTEQHDLAEADYRRALECDPSDRVARLGLADILLDVRRDGTGAAELFERAWQEQEDSAVALGLARSWRLLNRGDDSRTLLDGWLKRHPDDAVALAERGQLALDEHATAEAEKLLRRAVALTPYDREANYSLYVCLTRQGRTSEAEACQKRIDEAKQMREQIALLTRQLRAAPANVDLRSQIAELYLRFGAEEEGVRWLQTNLQLQPQHARTHRALADYYERKGATASAAEHRRLAGAVP